MLGKQKLGKQKAGGTWIGFPAPPPIRIVTPGLWVSGLQREQFADLVGPLRRPPRSQGEQADDAENRHESRYGFPLFARPTGYGTTAALVERDWLLTALVAGKHALRVRPRLRQESAAGLSARHLRGLGKADELQRIEYCTESKPPRGFEPRTPALRKPCSTAELRRRYVLKLPDFSRLTSPSHSQRNSRAASAKLPTPQQINTRTGPLIAAKPPPSLMTARNPLFSAVNGNACKIG